jgi:divalent metal cation (Fe/Co/Zn/Cd) transporter
MSSDDHGHDHDHDHDHDHAHPRGWAGRVRAHVLPHRHDAAESLDSAVLASEEGMRTLKLSLVALGVTAVLQVLVVVISGSVALLADTIHNFSDALTAIPLGIAFWLGRRPPNRRYPYGYGRSEDLAGIFVLVMIAASSAIAAYEAVNRLLHPRDITNIGWVAAAGVIGFAGN